MLEHGIVTDDASRTRLLTELDRALRQAAEQQLQRAEADYTPDPKGNRFPDLSIAPKAAPEGSTIRGLFKLWERDHLANGKSARTVGDFRHKVEALIECLGHEDPKADAAVFHQGGDLGDATGQSVQLRDQERSPQLAAKVQGLGEFRAVAVLARLNLGELGHDLEGRLRVVGQEDINIAGLGVEAMLAERQETAMAM